MGVLVHVTPLLAGASLKGDLRLPALLLLPARRPGASSAAPARHRDGLGTWAIPVSPIWSRSCPSPFQRLRHPGWALSSCEYNVFRLNCHAYDIADYLDDGVEMSEVALR